MLLLSSFLFYDVTFYGWAPWDCYWAEVDRWRCQPDMRTNTYNSYNLDLSTNLAKFHSDRRRPLLGPSHR